MRPPRRCTPSPATEAGPCRQKETGMTRLQAAHDSQRVARRDAAASASTPGAPIMNAKMTTRIVAIPVRTATALALGRHGSTARLLAIVTLGASLAGCDA